MAAVEYQVNGGPFQRATGTAEWEADVSLLPGENIVRARARDLAGNLSPEVGLSLTYIASSPLTLNVVGSGTVSPNLDGQNLVIGKTYTVRARPARGQFFSSWSGDVVSIDSTLKFVMQSNMVIQANFIPNPFTPAAGKYNGLVYVEEDPEHETSGFISLRVTDKGKFSAQIRQGTGRVGFSGQFDMDGKSSQPVTPRDFAPLQVELSLDLTDHLTVTGRVVAPSWTATVQADRAAFHTRDNPATAFENKYNMIIPGDALNLDTPDGDGFANVSISKSGAVSLRGVMADGSRFSQRVPLSESGNVPFYASLDRGDGSIIGWLEVLGEVDNDIGGRVYWFKPPFISHGYPNGFIAESMVEGSVYTKPGTNKLFAGSTAQVVFTGGDLLAAFTNTVSLEAKGKVMNESANKMLLRLTTGSGLIRGKVEPPAPNDAGALNFQGVLLQKQGYASGFFIRNYRSGRFHLAE